MARYGRFRARWPKAQLADNSNELRLFVESEFGSNPANFARALARAFQAIELRSVDNAAALEILGYVYSFPSKPIVVTESSYSFAQSDGRIAVYYLSETWTIPFTDSPVLKRFTVEWFRNAAGIWLLNDVK